MSKLRRLLIEGRKENLINKYEDDFGQVLLNVIENDFSKKTNYKYVDWLFSKLPKNENIQYLGHVVDDVMEYLTIFDNIHSNLDKKDINQYKTIDEFQDVISTYIENRGNKEGTPDVEKIYEDNKFLVIIPKNEIASCKYGANTKWCVTSKGSGHFEMYTERGQLLYFIIDKENSTDKNFSKIAIHYDVDGVERAYNSRDILLSNKELAVLEYAFPKVLNSIRKHFKEKFQSGIEQFLRKVFDVHIKQDKEKFGESFVVKMTLTGFDNDESMPPGHASGKLGLKFFDRVNGKQKGDVEYLLLISYANINNIKFSVDVTFMELSEIDDYIPIRLDSHELNLTSRFENTPEETAITVAHKILQGVSVYLRQNKI